MGSIALALALAFVLMFCVSRNFVALVRRTLENLVRLTQVHEEGLRRYYTAWEDRRDSWL